MRNTKGRNYMRRGFNSGMKSMRHPNEKRNQLLANLISIMMLFSTFSVLLILTASQVSANANIVPAGDGYPGNPFNISADDAGGNWTALVSGISIEEGAIGDIAVGGIVLTIPDGFEFNTTVTAPDVYVVGTGGLVANPTAAMTLTTLTVTIIDASTSDPGTLTIGYNDSIFVRPINHTPLASGNITMTSGTIAGVDGNTSFGTLNEVAGDVDPYTSGVEAQNSPQAVGDPITINITLKDSWGNSITDAMPDDFDFAYTGNTSAIAPEDGYSNCGDGIYTWDITYDVAEESVTVTVSVKSVVINQTVNLIWNEPLPLVFITNPVNNSYYSTLTTINGTVTDIMEFGINCVNVTIYNASSGEYWNGTDWDIGVQWLTTNLAGHSPITWTYNSATVTWLNGTHYLVNIIAVDNESRESIPVSSIFLYDTKAPTVSIAFNNTRTYYKEGEVVRIYVNFTEDGSGINESSILVNITANGTSLGSVNASSLMNTDKTHWYYDLTVSSGHDGNLNISVNAKDNASLSLAGTTWNNLKYLDTTAPTATVEYNNSATYFKVGTRVKLYVNLTEATSGINESTLILNITTNGDGGLNWITMNRTDNTHWIWNWTIPSGSDDDGEIIVQVSGSDNATNSLNRTNITHIYIDNTAPTGNITQYGSYNDSLVNISGTANDSGSGIATVNISLYNVTNATYWTGTVWQPSCHQLPVNGTTTWYFSNGSMFPVFSNGTTYIVNLTVNDTIGNSNTSADSNSFFYDTFPPQLSGISAGSITTNSVMITWTSNENATSIVEYGTTVSYGSWSNSSTYTTVHSRSLSGLSSSTTYHYRVISSDPAGNHVNSSDFTFTTETEGPSGGGGVPPSSGLPPVASAGGPYFGYVNQSITFDGSRSNDTDGTIVGYRWDWTNDGIYDTEWSTSPITTHIYTAAGTYMVQLQVKDSDGFRDTDTAYANITSIQPLPPVADTEGPYSGLTYQNIHFDGSGSLGTDGIIVNYTWDFGDGTFGYLISPVHSYDSDGTFTVTLTVTDNNDLQDNDTTTATILLDANRDNVSDIIEHTIGANITPSDMHLVQFHGAPYYLIDTNGDGIFDVMYNPRENTKTMLGQQDGKQLIDVDGDGIWDCIYDPVLGALTPYTKETPTSGFPWMMIAIIAITLVIIALLFWLYKTGRL
jgi:PKD repeat protein